MIDVHFEARCDEVDEGEIRRTLEFVLAGEGRDLAVEVAVVDDAAIRSVNCEFLDHDYATDVIAFDLGDDPSGGPVAQILVSIDTARREAAARGLSTATELLLYCVHGLLHLLGYDDHDADDRARMHARQRDFLGRLGHLLPAEDD